MKIAKNIFAVIGVIWVLLVALAIVGSQIPTETTVIDRSGPVIETNY